MKSPNKDSADKNSDVPTTAPSISLSEGIEIQVRPELDASRSQFQSGVFVYRYHITITNRRNDTVRLLSRHWIIRDGFDRVEHVRGPGVVGQHPVLHPEQIFTYSSFCPLSTPSGSMQGSFRFVDQKGGEFDSTISEFYLRHEQFVN